MDKTLNITATKDGEEVSLQITSDMKIADVMVSMQTWFDMGYSIKGGK